VIVGQKKVLAAQEVFQESRDREEGGELEKNLLLKRKTIGEKPNDNRKALLSRETLSSIKPK